MVAETTRDEFCWKTSWQPMQNLGSVTPPVGRDGGEVDGLRALTPWHAQAGAFPSPDKLILPSLPRWQRHRNVGGYAPSAAHGNCSSESSKDSSSFSHLNLPITLRSSTRRSYAALMNGQLLLSHSCSSRGTHGLYSPSSFPYC